MNSIDDTTTTLVDYDDAESDKILILDGKERLRYFLNLQSPNKATHSRLRKSETGLFSRLRQIFS